MRVLLGLRRAPGDRITCLIWTSDSIEVTLWMNSSIPRLLLRSLLILAILQIASNLMHMFMVQFSIQFFQFYSLWNGSLGCMVARRFFTGEISLENLPNGRVSLGLSDNYLKGTVSFICLPTGLNLLDLSQKLLRGLTQPHEIACAHEALCRLLQWVYRHSRRLPPTLMEIKRS